MGKINNITEGPTILDSKIDLRVVLNSLRCIQDIKKISGLIDILVLEHQTI